MKRGLVFTALLIVLALLLIAFIPFSSAVSLDVPIQELTYQAEQYETGNINYAQLLIYLAALKRDVASSMGASSTEKDYMLSEEQLTAALGKATDYTRWVWVENRDEGGGYEKKIDNQAPTWRKIIFDGNKIQILLNAWPQIRMLDGNEKLYYGINMETRFKSPSDDMDIQAGIDEVKSAGEKYAGDHSESNLYELAEKSVTLEQAFQKYYESNPAKCYDLMNGLFGSENKKATQKLLHDEIDFASGEKTEVMINLEMCDDCEWSWINLNANVRTRGSYNAANNQEGNREEMMSRYTSYSDEEFKAETKKILEEIKQAAVNDQVSAIFQKSQELSALSEAWNEKDNRAVEENKNNDIFETMTPEERDQCSQNFCWIKKEQERRENERAARNQKYQERKQFYLSLFADSQIKESYYEEEQWEKRIFEKFMESGEEICSNNIDDNKNNQIDCADSQCSGKKCGQSSVNITEGNETKEETVELFCISGTCQQKEYIAEGGILNESICGNHICEENESLSCLEDCGNCTVYEAINCTGQVIFSGKDESGCMLPPICLDENDTCSSDDDCPDALCGNSSCVEGKCQITELSECKEPECTDGEEKTMKCDDGQEIVTEKCIDATWKSTGLDCEISVVEANETIDLLNDTFSEEDRINENIKKGEIKETPISASECLVKEDCGNENDVCSNGKCNTLPETTESAENVEVEVEIPESTESAPETAPEAPSENTEIKNEGEAVTGGFIFNILSPVAKNIMTIIGFDITDVVLEENTPLPAEDTQPPARDTTQPPEDNPQPPGDTTNPPPGDNPQPPEDNPQPPGENPQPYNENPMPDNNYNDENNNDEQLRREEEEAARRKKECDDRCTRECNDRLIRPCVEDCIWKKCGNELKCNVDDTTKLCQEECNAAKDVTSCEQDCNTKCIAGEDTYQEPEKTEKQPEALVLSVIGSCRKATGREDTMLWFNAWGNEMKNNFQNYKNKYYNWNDNKNWCKQELESLIKQRKELENSLNNAFAEWFFEKYVVNTDEEWEKHISGIFDLYWMEVEISKQMADRMKCLGITTLPDYKLINFSYKAQFGSIDFWEEISSAKLFDDSEEVQVISPFMRTWLFPTQSFYKYQMKKSMETHQMIGPDTNTPNTLSTEVTERLKQDKNFMGNVRKFNEAGYTTLALQLKDYNTDEIVYNVLIKINENDLMYFEPMPVSELPSGYVTASLDVSKMIEMIEFEEKGRVELQSPPWDRRPKEGIVKGVVDNVKMYLKFQGFMNSLKVSEEGAKSEAKFFVENFFKLVMNGGNDQGPEGNSEEDKTNGANSQKEENKQ